MSRWGGEKFLVMASGTDLKGAKATALRLREVVMGARLGVTRPETASFGVATA